MFTLIPKKAKQGRGQFELEKDTFDLIFRRQFKARPRLTTPPKAGDARPARKTFK
jgi:hypothetical protein